MSVPNVMVLRAPGTNCDEETAFAFEQAGGRAERIHINRLLEQPRVLEAFQIVCIPGGFSYGDDIAAGRILANQLMAKIADSLRAFRDAGKLILGICNGFQVLIKSGLLIDEGEQGFDATLTWNLSGRYEDRWVHLQTGDTSCVFLKDIEGMYLPIAHAEGRFAIRNREVFTDLADKGQLALCYARATAESDVEASDKKRCGSRDPNSIYKFPTNPNGSTGNVAGLCDVTGRVFGMMPHPERFIERTQHPHWTRLDHDVSIDGRKIFENAVRLFH